MSSPHAKPTKPTRQRARNVTTAPPAKFQVGMRVVVDFTKGGKISGLTARQCQVPGLITGISGRFLRTAAFARWCYRVRLDRQFCSEELWTLDEGHLALEVDA